jgi:glutamyl-tRNA reductase
MSELVAMAVSHKTAAVEIRERGALPEARAAEFMRDLRVRPTGLATAIYSHHNCDAARHPCRVVAGLESMLVGEAGIQSQRRSTARGYRRT